MSGKGFSIIEVAGIQGISISETHSSSLYLRIADNFVMKEHTTVTSLTFPNFVKPTSTNSVQLYSPKEVVMHLVK